MSHLARFLLLFAILTVMSPSLSFAQMAFSVAPSASIATPPPTSSIQWDCLDQDNVKWKSEVGGARNVARHVDDFISKAVGTPGGDTEIALFRLQQDGASAVAILKDRYAGMPKTAYYSRWVAVNTLSLIGHPSEVDLLREIVNEPLPRDPPGGCHIRCPLDQELTVRFAALRGLGLLFSLGNVAALQTLLDVMRGPLYGALKGQALRVYLYFAKDSTEAQRKLCEALPAAEQERLRIRLQCRKVN